VNYVQGPTRRENVTNFILQGLNAGFLEPTIDKVFTFDEIDDRHRYINPTLNLQFAIAHINVAHGSSDYTEKR
jgi:hypothetical protein